MSNSMATLAQVADALRAHDNFVICGHTNPDGDCIGSGLLLGEALRSLGKDALCLLAEPDSLDYSLSNLPGVEMLVAAQEYTQSDYCFVTVDLPEIARMGQAAALLHTNATFTISIDHYQSHGAISNVHYVDTNASACASIVWDLVKLLGVQPTPTMAACAYVGLMTDTGSFQYQNTTPAALAHASEMVACGANPHELASLMYHNRSLASFKLEQAMLSHLVFSEDGSVLVGYLTQEEFARSDAKSIDASMLIDVLRSFAGVRVCCLLREQGDVVRGSLRAKDTLDVSAVAAVFGGGGHKAAAGFTYPGSLDEGVKQLCQLLAQLVSQE